MSELSEQLRALVEATPPVTLDEVEGRAGVPEAARPGRPSRRAWLVAAVAVVVAGLAVALVVVATGDDDLDVRAGVEDPAVGDKAAWAWLDDLELAPVAAPAPEGWTVLDVDDVRFAVPPGWEVSTTGCPVDASTPGVVVVGDGLSALVQCAFGPPVARVLLGSVSPSVPGEPVMLGALSAERIPNPGCTDCGTAYRLESGLVVTLDGPDSEAIAATFGSSPARQALSAGPVVDAAGWQAIEHGGVSLSVPPSWSVADLAAQRGVLDPGSCRSTMFDPGGVPTAAVGESSTLVRCRDLSGTVDLRPASGVWLRTISAAAAAAALGPTLASGEVDGMAVAVVDVDRSSTSPLGSTIDLVVTTPTGMVQVTIGGGADPAEARAILRSLRSSSGDGPEDDGVAPSATARSEEDESSASDGLAVPGCGWEGSVDVMVFLDVEAGDAGLGPMEAVVRARPGVLGVVPMTQADSLVDFRETFVDSPELVESVTAADLPPALQVDLADDVDPTTWAEGLDEEPGVHEVVVRAEQHGACEDEGPISPEELDDAWDELKRQEATGWVPYSGRAAIPGLAPPSDAWVPAGVEPRCERPASLDEGTQHMCVFDAPSGTVVGYHISNLGFVPVDRIGSFDVGRQLVDRYGCDPRADPGWADPMCIAPSGAGGDAGP